MLGTPADPPAIDADDPLGPPVLLKRLGNAFEGELARSRLADAEIPSFLAGVDTFNLNPRAARGQVELFVPRSLVDAALDVLDTPPLESHPDDEVLPDDPGRPLGFRAFVTAVSGWMVLFLGPFGVGLAVPLFVYAFVLAGRAVRRSPVADRTLRLQVAAAGLLALVGLVVCGLLLADMRGWI